MFIALFSTSSFYLKSRCTIDGFEKMPVKGSTKEKKK